jgi:hypothetical protein
MDTYEFNTDDVVFHIHLGRFGKVFGQSHWLNALNIKADDTHGYHFIWMKENIIKVNPDTPQNRLALQLKYAK